MTRTTVPISSRPLQRYTVSQRHDPAESQAHRAADVVARGGSVAGWSFSAVPTRDDVHREESGAPKSEDEKYKEAAGKIGEAALESPIGKKLQEKVREDPLVKQGIQFLDTPAGKVVAGGVIAGGVAGLASTGQPLPVQAPAIPLDRITPGLSAKVTVQGPLNAPTFVGLSLSYKEQGPKSGPGKDQKEKYRAETARLKASLALPKSTADTRAEEAELARIIAGQRLLGSTTLIPLLPSDKPKTVHGPPADKAEDTEQKKPDDAPIQRDPAPGGLAAPVGLDTSAVEGVVSGGGRHLDPGLRRTMEARFGYDFGSVRIHDDAHAHAAARDVQANAFTVGDHIAFAAGRFAPQSPEGAHVLAHELAHVVQQQGGTSSTHVQRQEIPAELQTSVDLSQLSQKELNDRHARLLETLAQFSHSTPETDLLADAAGAIGVELARRHAIAEGRTFSSEAIGKMRDYFVQNAKTEKDSCIVALNKGMKVSTADPALPTTSKSIEATMAKMVAAGRSSVAREIGFKSKSGRITHGGARPEHLASSVFDAVLDMAAGDPGWSVFTLSLLDGFHSVTLTLDSSEPTRPHVYWSDQWQSKGGWKEYSKAGLDTEVTHLVQSWWDGQPEGKKHRTIVRLWRVRAAAAAGGGP
jgi:hypothetical protein